MILISYFSYIGGNVINITIAITSEACIDGKYNQSLLLEKLRKPVRWYTYNLDIAVKATNKLILVTLEGFVFAH